MIAGAVLIVASVFINVKGITGLGANIGQLITSEGNNSVVGQNGSNQNKITRSDIDQDGLFDEEEPLYRTDPLNKDTDGDGFLDGEEVAAGCSPISASPKDCNLSKLGSSNLSKINLTDYFASLVVGGFLSNDLKKEGSKFGEYISDLQNEALNIQKTLLSVDETEFKTEVSKDDSKKASQEYLDNLESIFKSRFLKQSETDIGKNGFNDFDYSPYLEDAKTTYEGLAELKPPPNWVELHQKLLKFFYELKTYFLNLKNQEKDPIKALLTLKNTDKLITDYDALIKEVSEKIKTGELKTKIFNP